MHLIDCQQLNKIYYFGEQPFHALKNVSLKIAPGELVAIVGTSGSGKSTLLNLLGGLDRPTDGTIRINGVSLTDLSEPKLACLRNSEIGFVFQQFNLMSRYTVLRNVELPMLYANWSRADRTRRALELLDSMGISVHANKPPTGLSGGQQQRVAIARALALKPKLILADEPTGALDSSTSREVMRLLIELNESQKVTVVIVTHDQSIAAQCRRTITFSDGRIVDDLYRSEGAIAHV